MPSATSPADRRRPSGLRPPRPVLREPALERCLWAQTIQTWITQPSRGPWAVPAPQWRQRLTPRAAQRRSGNASAAAPSSEYEAERSVTTAAFLVSARVSQPRDACGFLFAGVSGYRKSHRRRNSARLYPNSQRHTHAVAILVEARRRRPMRAYVTAAGMALGLVGVWAALVPFVA